MAEIKLIVNSKEVFARDPEQTLLSFLRDGLGLVGAKDGCSRGQCGACTVIIDKKAVRACTRKMKQLEGVVVETVEGLAQNGELHPLQQAFLYCHAFQCGFCTPGIIMASKALLDADPHPTDDQIKQAIKFNICRCTGYKQVIDAVRLAIEIADGATKLDVFDNRGWVGDNPVVKNGVERVMGQPLFTDDFHIDNCLQGRVVFPAYPHAKILSIDCAEALKQPGVVAIATHKDIPGKKFFSQELFPQQILAIDKVRFIGDPIAVVYAESAQQAYDAMPFIKVEYEVLPVIATAEQGYDPESCRVHEEYPNNFANRHVQKGDVERGFAASDVIVESDVSVGTLEHGRLELDAALAELDEKGRLVVYGTGQNPSHMRHDICKAMNLTEEQIRLVTRPAGGAFGKLEDLVCHIFAALGTMMTKRPVRVTLTRDEVNAYTTKRHALKFHYKVGAAKDGRILAMQTFTLGDTGAYSSLGDFLNSCTATMGSGPYEAPNVDFNSHMMFTNNPIAGCFRGYGSTQVSVAVETVLDQVAEKLNLSPFELRRVNGLSSGKQTPSGQIIEYSCGFHDTINAVQTAFEKDGLPAPSAPGKKVGFGVAGGFKNMGFGNGMEDGAGCSIDLRPDGKFQMYTGGVELGQGHDTVVCQIAAQTLGVPYNDVDIGPVDDDYSPYAKGSTSASRMTYCSGNAARTCSIMFKDKLLKTVGGLAGVSPSAIDMGKEGIVELKADQLLMTYAEAAKLIADNNASVKQEYYYVAGECHAPCDDNNNIDMDMINHRIHIAYLFAAQVAVVEVDEETGKVKVLRVYVSNDCGRAINPAMVEGQINGSVVMGMGYALSEKFEMEDGYIKTKGYKQLGLPTSLEMPEIKAFLIEENHPFGPYGAKGLGEMALNPTAPAILNAIYNAVGVRVTSLPVDPKKLAAAIKGDKIYR